MARPPASPTTVLGTAIRALRASKGQVEVAEVIGISRSSLADVERGTHMPTYATAVKLAAWLRWTTDQVMAAASEPAPANDNEGAS